MMDRRTFLAGTGAVLLAAPLAAEGQQAAVPTALPGLGDYVTGTGPRTGRAPPEWANVGYGLPAG